MSKQLNTFLQENRIAKHVLALITMLVLVILIGGIKNNVDAVFYTLLAYSWFIFTTKMDIQWNIIILLSLLLIFLYENNMDNKEIESSKDPSLTKNDVKYIIDNNIEHKNYMFMSVAILTMIGLYFYINKKEGQHGGGNFNPTHFFLY